jgi:hypothetical protein
MTLPANRNAPRTADQLVRRNPKGVYNIPAPTIKPHIADRIRAVEAAAAQSKPRVLSRCCGRCKTPYNCGNGWCACHSQARLEAGLTRPLKTNPR